MKARYYLIAAYAGLLLVRWGGPYWYLKRKVDTVDDTTGLSTADYEQLSTKYTSRIDSMNPVSAFINVFYVLFRLYGIDFWKMHYWAIKSLTGSDEE